LSSPGLVGLVVLMALALSLILTTAFIGWWSQRYKRHSEALESRVQERTEALALRNKALERAHHQLQKNLEGRIQLMNTVIHDIRSPLTSILISVERIRDGQVDHASAINLIERESHRLEKILTKLLDQSRSEGICDTLNLRLCRPSEILQGFSDTFRIRAEAKDLFTNLDLDAASDRVWILADTTALQQVVFNLIENALKFTDPPGTIGIRSRVDKDQFCMEVWDTGRGIESSKKEAIFQPFKQAEDEDCNTGWGLGLSICSAMVKAHQGHIELRSEVGKGSTFRVSVPLVMPATATR